MIKKEEEEERRQNPAKLQIDEDFFSSEDKLKSIQKYSSVVELIGFSPCRFQDI